MEWDSSFVEEIRSKRDKERELAPEMAKRQDNLLMLISKSLYGEKVHYALELIQNAEDCGSSSITFIFETDKIIVINDGDVFTSEDVEGICSVEPGRKKNKIGFFGVGFKSVFNVTKTPQIISNDFNFEIKNYICPNSTSDVPEVFGEYYSKERGSIFVLPQSESLSTIPELIENFKEIDEKILLFLNNVKSLRFIDKVNNEQWSIEKLPSEISLIALKNGRTDQATKWRVFHKDLPVSSQEVQIPEEKKGVETTRIVIAFPCDQATREAIKGSTLYCYLPTKKRTDIPFLVQADFVPTVGRGDIQDIDWNKWLLRKLGELSAEAIDEIKEDKTLGKDFYDFIPLNGEVRESLMNILSDSMYDSLHSKPISRTSDSEWKKAEECVIPLTPEVIEIIHKKELPCLFGKPLSYTDATLSERAKRILTELCSSVLDEGKFIEFLSKEDLIKKRKPEWFLRAYSFLSEIFDTTKKDYLGNFRWDQDKKDLFAKLEKTKFILTNQQILVPLKDPKNPDKLICYPQSIDLSEVNELFTEGELVFLHRHFQSSTITKRKDTDPQEEQRRERVHEFFENVGVRLYFKQSHVIKDVILSKYSSGKYKDCDDLKQYRFLNFVREYWPTLESEVKNKKLSDDIFDTIRNTILVKAFIYKNGEKVSCYIPPKNVYFTKRYGKTERMEELFDGVEGIYFLHPYYLNREKHEQEKKKKRGRQKVEVGWKKFFEMLGVWSSPRVEKDEGWVSISGKQDYEWVKKEYSPSGIHELFGNSRSPDIEKLIEYCSNLKDVDTIRQRTTILLESLSDNWKDYTTFCKTRYKYIYRTDHYVDIPSSSFLDYLKKAQWIPTVDGSFVKPEEGFLDTARNRFLLGDDVRFVNLTGSQAFFRDVGVNLEPSIEQVINHLKTHKENVNAKKKGELEKFKEIYLFLAEKVQQSQTEEGEPLKTIQKEFDDSALLYIPRKDRTWWKPRQVFWKDYSNTFGTIRGYIENEGKELYPQTLKNFMASLGLTEKPTIKQSLQVLEELKQRNDLETLRRIATKTYGYINDQLAHNGQEPVDWNEYTFLTAKGNLCKPLEVYFEDDEEYAKNFHEQTEFLHLRHTTFIRLSQFLNSAGFKSFSSSLSVTKHLGEVTEVEGGELNLLKKSLNLAGGYLLNKYPETYERLQSEGVFEKIPNFEAYEASQIKIDLFLTKDEAESLQGPTIEKEAYHSLQENRLYVLNGTNIFSEKVAKEASRIFRGAENEVFPFLNSILPKAIDEEALESQLQLFGIREETYTGPVKVQLLPEEEKTKTQEELSKDAEEEKEKLPDQTIVTPPITPKPRRDLIDPNEYFPSTIKELMPYQKTEGETPKITRQIDLKEGKTQKERPTTELKIRAGTIDAEEIAIRMVINSEEQEGRKVEDRHKQKSIGYDLYSTKDEAEERFIEIKHFGEQEGTFKLTPHQHEKAKKEGDKYYVYVVSGLKEGLQPKIRVIQNPIKSLTPDPPIEAQYSDWKHAVMREIEFGKA